MMAFDPDKYLESKAPKKAENLGEFIKQKAPFTTGTVPAFARGAVNKVRQTTSQPVLRFLANAGLPSAREEIAKIDEFNQGRTPSTAEKAGGLVADVAMMAAPTPMGKGGVLARGMAAGAQGAAQHQAQNYAKTGEIDPASAAIETGATAVTMGAASKIEPILKWLGVKGLQGLTRASKSIQKGANPPTTKGFQQALENRLVPIVKGGYGEAEKRGMALQGARDAERARLLSQEGIKTNVRGDLAAARRELQGNVTGSSGMLPEDIEAATGVIPQLDLAARSAGMNKGGYMEGPDAIEFRKMLDQYSKFQPEKVSKGTAAAAEASRRKIEDQLLTRMAGRSSEGAYKGIKQDMGELAPVLNAFGDKAVSNYSFFPELIGAGLGGAAALGGGSLSLGMIPLALAASRRYPGSAAILYEGGRAAGSKGVKQAAKTALDLGRSSYYGGE